MPAPTVTVLSPGGDTRVPDGADGILRPTATVIWTGGVGPFDVLHEWDLAPTFDTGALLQDSNPSATSPDVGTPPSDLGGATWYYRATVTDTDDAAAATTSDVELVYFDQIDAPRFLYMLGNVGVAFYPTDTDDPAAIDGDTIDFRRYIYLLGNVGVSFYPTDTDDLAEAADGDVREFRRFLYLLGNVNTDTPTPHIWYVFPAFGREGWEFRIVGYGFGDTQGEYTGTATLNGLAVGVISWELVAETGADMAIDPVANIAEPIHQLIRATVPTDGTSGLVVVCTDGP